MSYFISAFATIGPIITFDIALDSTQALSEHIYITALSGRISAVVTLNNNKVTIKPVQSLPACTSFTVTMDNDIKSVHGVSGG